MSDFIDGFMCGCLLGVYTWLCFTAPAIATALAFGVIALCLLATMVVWAMSYDKNRKRVR